MDHTCYIALGSNLGDRAATIHRAVDLLRAEPAVSSVQMSSLYETAPVGGPANQPPYLNAAARVVTSCEPHEFLALLLRTEQDLGRVRAERWGPRTLDLDLLLFEDQIINTPTLTVPHPRMHQRRFVLEPLAEIAPAVVHPKLKLTVAELLRRLNPPPA